MDFGERRRCVRDVWNLESQDGRRFERDPGFRTAFSEHRSAQSMSGGRESVKKVSPGIFLNFQLRFCLGSPR